ncbi:MAG: ABC transporter permease, partial [Muribaculaceae bacterium]
MIETGFWRSLKRGMIQLVRRPLYVVCMIVIPIATTFFLLNLMESGLPEKVPAAIIDLDHTEMSREIGRTL